MEEVNDPGPGDSSGHNAGPVLRLFAIGAELLVLFLLSSPAFDPGALAVILQKQGLKKTPV